MISFLTNNIDILKSLPSNCGMLGQEFYDILQYFFIGILVSVPGLVLVLCSVDMARAVIAQDENGMKQAQSRAIKRIMIGVAICFVPMLLNLVFKMSALAGLGTCGIG